MCARSTNQMQSRNTTSTNITIENIAEQQQQQQTIKEKLYVNM